MGYCMDQIDSRFYICQLYKDDALAALKNFAKTNDQIIWVNVKKLLAATTLKEALYECRWEVEENDRGDIDSISFHGGKMGNDELLFNSFAKYIRSDSYIEMCGEDRQVWRWVFYRSECKRIFPAMVWE
jgi:hypothetical protein